MLSDSPMSPLEVEPSVDSVSFRSDPSSPPTSSVDTSVSSKPGLSKLSLSSIPEVSELAALEPQDCHQMKVVSAVHCQLFANCSWGLLVDLSVSDMASAGITSL